MHTLTYVGTYSTVLQHTHTLTYIYIQYFKVRTRTSTNTHTHSHLYIYCTYILYIQCMHTHLDYCINILVVVVRELLVPRRVDLCQAALSYDQHHTLLGLTPVILGSLKLLHTQNIQEKRKCT